MALDILRDVLLDYDVFGAPGCASFSPRRNLLAEVQSRIFTEDSLVLQCKLWKPEGFGIERFMDDALVVPAVEETDFLQMLVWDVCSPCPPLNEKVWLNAVCDPVQTPPHLPFSMIFDLDSYWLPFSTDNDEQDDALRILELFSGAFAGWKGAVEFLQGSSSHAFRTIAIDSDLSVAMQYAVSFSTKLISLSRMPSPDDFVGGEFDLMLHGDICDNSWMLPVAKWGPNIVTISSPCPPWSGAASAPGLYRDDGLLLPKAILKCRFLRPEAILLEQVPGFSQHSQKDLVLRCLRWIGYRIEWQRVLNLADRSPVQRPRWLALAVRVHALTNSKPFQVWKKLPVDEQNHAFVLPLVSEELENLKLTEVVRRIASDPEMSHARLQDASPDRVLQQRCFQVGQIFPTFMAMYGSQHTLPEEHLKKFGYLGHFLFQPNEEVRRFLHPCEIALLHGLSHSLYVPHDLQDAWRAVGNMISEQQALLLLVNCINRLRTDCLDVHWLFARHAETLFTATNSHRIPIGQGDLLCHESATRSDDFVEAVQQLQSHLNDFGHTLFCWSPDVGFDVLYDPTQWTDSQSVHLVNRFQMQPSQLTQEDLDEVSPTMRWAPLLKAKIQFADHSSSFWFSADLSVDELVAPWGRNVTCTFQPCDDEGFSAILIASVVEQPETAVSTRSLVFFMDQGQLSVLPCDREHPLLTQNQISACAIDLWDAYGLIKQDTKAIANCLLVTDEIWFRTPSTFPAVLMASIKNTIGTWSWDTLTDTLWLSLEGDSFYAKTMIEFWGCLLHGESLKQLGRQVEYHDTNMVAFAAYDGSCASPHLAFREILAVAAVRSLLSNLVEADQDDERTKLLIHWTQNIWDLPLPSQTSLDVVMNLVDYGFSPILGRLKLRPLLCGKMPDRSLMVKEFPLFTHRDHPKLDLVLQLQGGAPTKSQQKTLHQNAIASLFLEQGHDLGWTTKTVAILADKCGLSRLQALTAMPTSSAKYTALDQLCKDCGVVQPAIEKPTSQQAFPHAPWNKNVKKKKMTHQQLDLSAFEIDVGFFQNEDGTPALQHREVRAQGTGIVLLQPQQAHPWLVTGEIISSDELGLLVVGPPPVNTKLSPTTVTFPCHTVEGQQVLLTASLFQLGSKAIRYNQGTPGQVKDDQAQMLAVTFHRIDWTDSEWNDILHGPQAFLRAQLKKQQLDGALQSAWGRSLRADKAPASPLQAQTVQIHAMFTTDKLDILLRNSGFNRIFVTPKLPNGRLNLDYRVIWTNNDRTATEVLSAKISNCLGLVRSKTNFGLRVRAGDFDAAWKVAHPNEPAQSKTAGDLVYKIEGLPFGCSVNMLENWLRLQQWKAIPIRALGSQTWLVRTEHQPPEGLLMFNTTPVLVRFLPPKQDTRLQTLVGPKPKSKGPGVPLPPLAEDPWSAWTGPRPTPATAASPAQRQLDGPTATRLTAQDGKIDALQTRLEQFEQHYQQDQQKMVTRMDQVDATTQDITKAVKELRGDMDQALQKTLQQTASMMDTKFDELKQLFAKPRAKRAQPSDADAPMEDWLGPLTCCLALIFLIICGGIAERPLLSDFDVVNAQVHWVCPIAVFAAFLAIPKCWCTRLGCILNVCFNLGSFWFDALGLPVQFPCNGSVDKFPGTALGVIPDQLMPVENSSSFVLRNWLQSSFDETQLIGVTWVWNLICYAVDLLRRLIAIWCTRCCSFYNWVASCCCAKKTPQVLRCQKSLVGGLRLVCLLWSVNQPVCALQVLTCCSHPTHVNADVFPGSALGVSENYLDIDMPFLVAISREPDFPLSGLACRVGEALHPGPDASDGLCRFALTNPTSIGSKVNVYQELASHHQIHTFAAAETAATAITQKAFAAAIKPFRVSWSAPCANHRDRTDQLQSVRGKASGVALLSKSPLRPAIATIEPEWQTTCRIAHHILDLHGFPVQVVTIYGQTPGGHQDAKGFNDRLLQVAINAIQALPLPAIICGDFNMEPHTLPSYDQLRQLGYSSLRPLYQSKFGVDMPPTCKEATWPDQAIFCPVLTSRVKGIQVLEDWHFDAHKVVTFDLHISKSVPDFRWSLPKSWIEMPIDQDLLERGYVTTVQNWGEPHSIQQWAMHVENSVDVAFRSTQQRNLECALSQTKGLPKKCRGRCIHPARKVVQPAFIMKPARPGEFNPAVEVTSRGHAKMVKQVRRIQALLRRLKKVGSPEPRQFADLQREWDAILRCDAFGPSFVSWCTVMPELGPPSFGIPTLAYLQTLSQLIQHETQMEVSAFHRTCQQKRTVARQLDSHNHGSSKAFMMLKESFDHTLTQLETQVQATAVPVWETNVLRLWCDTGETFASGHVVHVADAPAILHSQDAFSLTVQFHGPVPELHDEVEVSQKIIRFTPHDMFPALQRYWQPFWWHDSLSDGDEPAFVDALQTLPNLFQDFQFDMTSTAKWTTAVRQLKSQSCRGLDGISAAELQSLPELAIEHLASILNATDFPAELCQSRVFPLPKTQDHPGPGQIRPITVLPQLYRLWGRVSCTQILAHLSAKMPVNITGLLHGRGPADASFQLQWLLELSHADGTPCSGFSLDLFRCFNTIHRGKSARILETLGIPAFLLRKWLHCLQHMTRSWEIFGLCSTSQATNHGLPEGDSWSVVAMLGIAFTWTQLIQRQLPRNVPLAYADNWSWYTFLATDHRVALEVTDSFAKLLDMKVDWDKCWVWSTSDHHVDLLKHALQSFAPASTVQRVLSASDLGCQHTYRGTPRLGKLAQRFATAKRKLARMASMPHGFHTKQHLIAQGVFPAAFYGTELVPMTETHLNQLRAQVATALLGPSPSRNSAIAVFASPKCLEPFEFLMVRTLRIVRRFLHRFPDQQRRFFQLLARSRGVFHEIRGPAACLKYYLLQLGWTVSPEGLIHVSAFCSLHLCQDSLQMFARAVHSAWADSLLGAWSDRRSHRGLGAINHFDTVACFRDFTEAEVYQLLQEISGSFQTATQQAAWDSEVDDRCKFCQQPDTRHHRWFECAATAEVREQFHECVTFALEHLPYFADLPVLLHHPLKDFYDTIFWNQIEPVVDAHWVERLKSLADGGFQLRFYTDGACLFPGSVYTRHSAFAAVLDCAASDRERCDQVALFRATGHFPNSLKTFLMARTQGVQTILRAELMIVVLLCEMFPSCCIYTDSAVVVAWSRRCREGGDLASLQHLDHFDLIARLFAALNGGNQQVLKVKAHQDCTLLDDPLTCYHALGNRHADEAAGISVHSIQPALARDRALHHDELQQQRHMVKALYQLCLAQHQVRAQLEAQSKLDALTERLVTADAALVPVQRLMHWQFDDAWQPPDVNLSFVEQCAWGPTIANSVLEWLRQVRWPQDDVVTAEDPGITWIELAVSWSLWAGLLVPFRRQDQTGRELLICCSTIEDAQVYDLHFNELGYAFSSLLPQMNSLTDVPRWPLRSRGMVKSLYQLGASTFSNGLFQRPTLPNQAEVATLLAAHFRAHRQKAFQVLPPMKLQPRLDLDLIRREVRDGWQKMSQQTYRHARRVTVWRKAQTPR